MVFSENEPKHNKMTYAPNKDSDQSVHLYNLIREFTVCSVHSKIAKTLGFFMRSVIKLGGGPG